MKNLLKIKSFIIVFVTLGLFSSCEKLLEENPKDRILPSNFFATESDAISAVNAVYGILNAKSSGTFGGVYHSNYWIIQGLASDEMNNEMAGAVNEEALEQFAHTPDNTVIFDVWQNIYSGIFYANFAVDGITPMEIEEDLKNRLLGEARFLRAILYFDLVRMFGEVPLVTYENQSDLSPDKASTDEIFTFILEDLAFAKANLPESYPVGNGLGRATWGAATAMLGRVNLWTGDYAAAVTNLEEVIDSDLYDLYPDFRDAFQIENENGQETVFGIGFGDGGGAISFWEVGQFNVRLLPRELVSEISKANSQGWQVPTQNLYDQYDDLDRRKTITFITEVNPPGGPVTVAPHFSKYWDRDSEPDAGNTEMDFPHIRYSGVLLMYAEALNELNDGPNTEAYNAINEVRRRARFDGTVDQNVLPDLSGLTYQQFKDAVLLERRLELAAEGHRWFDLVRHGKLVERVNAAKTGSAVQSFHTLFPLPQREVDLNPKLLPQNTGY